MNKNNDLLVKLYNLKLLLPFVSDVTFSDEDHADIRVDDLGLKHAKHNPVGRFKAMH